jgi:Na+-transporting NADH:ubiquinone oxidoreductase subunit C
MANESTLRTVGVAAGVCIVCSVLVSTASVKLRPIQEKNKSLYMKENILLAADLKKRGDDQDVEKLFENIEEEIINLQTDQVADDMDPEEFDFRKAAKDPAQSTILETDEDMADIRRRPNYAPIYFYKKDGKIQSVILPIYGRGLWSTMYGFLALDRDLNTIKNIGFYEDGETPGLGGEINNPQWQDKWVGKKAFDKSDNPVIRVLRGSVDPDDPNVEHQVDGIAGATLTSNGVTNTVRFWLGDHGFGPYLDKLREQIDSNSSSNPSNQ